MTNRDEKGRYLVGNEPGPGRKSKYEPWMDAQVFRLALLGLTDEEMAKALGISHETFYRWQDENPAFCEAIQSGKVRADAEIAHSLFQRAKGMVVTSERAFKDKKGEVVVAQMKTEIPPDSRAAIHWLANRRRKGWGSYDEQAAEKATDLEDDTSPTALREMSRDDLQERIRVLEERRKHEEGKT